MARRKVDAREALQSIRGGMDDHALMQKYALSAKGLQSLFRKLVNAGALSQDEVDLRIPSFFGAAFLSGEHEDAEGPESSARRPNAAGKVRRPPIPVGTFLRDIRAGMTDWELMEKWRLSSKGLQSLFEQLLDSGLVGQTELDQRMSTYDGTVDLLEVMKQLGVDQRATANEGAPKALEKCPACGAPQTILFEECPVCGVNREQFKKRQEMELRVSKAKWKCPACGRPWTRQFDECPVCGVIISKLKDH